MLIFICIYVYVCLGIIAGYLGRHRKLGFMGFFVISLFFTPLLVFLILTLTVPEEKKTEQV